MMADADHDAVRQLACAAPGTGRTPDLRRARTSTSSRKTTFGLVSRTRANAIRCCSPGENIFAQSATSSSRLPRWPIDTVSRADRISSSEKLPSPAGIRDHRAQISQRHIGQLGQEHGVVLGVAQRARRERPQLRQAAQQCGLAGARAAGDHHRVAGIEPHVERVDQPYARRRPHLDVVELHRTVSARQRGQ